MNGLTRITVNLTPGARRALDHLAPGYGGNRTDAVCAALRLAEQVQPLVDDRGGLTVVSGRQQVRVVIL